MIIIQQIKTEVIFEKNDKITWHDKDILKKKAAKLLGISVSEVSDIQILKHSIDARKKPQLFHVYTLGITLKDNTKEQKVLHRCKNKTAVIDSRKPYQFPSPGAESLKESPVIIGMGPAGLFCGYMLAIHGYKPILLERGQDIDTRTQDVEMFWNSGILNPESNVQFGEGGAGTFSDGKLNTLIKDRDGRNKEVLHIFSQYGAPDQILYENKPHIGTDVLKKVVVNMRNAILEAGGMVRFGAKVTGFQIADQTLKAVIINNHEILPATQAVLAIGHSARDTFAYLDEISIPMEAKSFAVGMRVEHPQQIINEYMYGKEHGTKLPAAPYKLTAQTSINRGVYSFCMCPGGYVVNASSETGQIAVNGMSYSDRSSPNANSAIIVQVTPNDYTNNNPLAGVEFQRQLEKKAYVLGKGKIPVQYFGDFIKNCSSAQNPDIENYNHPCIKGEYTLTNLRGLLPQACEKAFIEGMEQFDRIIPGYGAYDAILSGIESRTSSPIRIHRNEALQSPSVKGLYPCGEGAGYAGGITSAAMDGILIAETIAQRFKAFF